MAEMITPSSARMTTSDLAQSQAGQISWITGPNFSGRTTILRTACEVHTDRPGLAILLSPEVHDAISGLMPTVAEELLLHDGESAETTRTHTLAEDWGLAALRERDPFTLSGGEQAMLVLLCKLGLHPRLLALDGALEQLDPTNLAKALIALAPEAAPTRSPTVLLTHNGHLPPNEVPTADLPAATFTDIERMPNPPPLDDAIFAPPPVPEPVSIHTNGLAFRYPRGAAVFKNLNLRLEPGRIYRLAGPNGCGKSTLARLLTGVLRPSSGEILANGRPFDAYSHPGSLARLHFQSPDSQLFEATVRDELHPLPPPTAEAATRFAGLQGFLAHHPFDLPFVLRKRLALTLILHTSAPWLIFDEPTLGQDEHSRAAISTALRRLATAGHGLIIISHNAEFAQSSSDEELDLRRLING